jgi:plastocyanin
MDATHPSTGAGRRAGASRLGRAPAAAAALLTAAGILLIAAAPVSSAAVDRSWRGSVGSGGANGTVTVVALVTGTGSVGLRLKALPMSAPVTVTIRAGTCARPGSVATTLPATRSSATGAVSRTVAVGRTAVSRMKTASALIVQVRSTRFSRCAVLRRVTTPGPSPSPSSNGEVEVRARDFAFSPATITAVAGKPIVVSFRNDDAGIPHGMNVATSASGAPIASSAVITGVARTTFTIPALSAGTYVFWCPVHPSMTGRLTITGASGASASPTAGAGATASPGASPTGQPSPGGTASPTSSPTLPPTPEPTDSPDPNPSYSPY